jgi:hypothetical protein
MSRDTRLYAAIRAGTLRYLKGEVGVHHRVFEQRRSTLLIPYQFVCADCKDYLAGTSLIPAMDPKPR